MNAPAALPTDFLAAVEKLIPAERRFDDPLSTLAFGTDASFYRLIPKLVVRVESEMEVVGLLKLAHSQRVPVTFRAAGTSLSGQAISDSVLIVLGDNWNGREIRNGGEQIRLQPGVIGANANAILAPLQRKIGPDPASINAAKIGGIVANNSSGMCCGTAQNSYKTLAGLRLALADGSVVDSEDATSVEAFRQSHAAMLDQLAELGRTTRANTELAAKIRHKYRLKNTTGFSLNALVDYDEPLDILNHLMVGSEGTLGFISAVTYDTVPDHPHKASALVVFPDVETCCLAVPVLKQQPVSAVELLDRRSLRSVENKAGMPEWVKQLSANACALLIESRAASGSLLHEQINQIMVSIAHFPVEKQVDFSEDPVVYNQLWKIRKDTFPAVGAVRQTGTTVIIEDVTFPIERLAEGVNRLIQLFEKHTYSEAILFGHALEGNLHFVFTQGFDDPLQVARYEAFMQDVTQLVAVEFGGALKAEHGTGRNMAPFVELEWGNDAYQLMWQIKRLLDPQGILNPDVVLSEDPQIHLKHLKPMPAADEILDKCIECGFCEPVCPSNGLTLTPRQRIVVWRDIQAKKRAGIDTSELEQLYDYQGVETCAATGLCAQRCPVGINTGDLVRKLRGRNADNTRAATWLAEHFRTAVQGARFMLHVANGAHLLMGTRLLSKTSAALTNASKGRVPQWSSATPQPLQRLHLPKPSSQDQRPRVVYLAACVSRAMGPAARDQEQEPLLDTTRTLLEKAGYQVIFPDELNNLCCGQPFASKGYAEQAEQKRQETLDALLKASRGGLDPIYCDTSPCTLRLVQDLADDRLQVFDPVRFIRTHLIDKLDFEPQDAPIAVHVTCSTQHLGEAQALIDIARRCAKEVVVPEGIHCCGFAGDKGFTTPELNAHALRSLKDAVQVCEEGISTSRTCEIGLSQHGGIDYHGLVYLVNRNSRARAAAAPY
ncbi:MAG: FAD-binding oxidoreductase [Gammaproteobacteria bacterium]|uniref:FAD-binding and (Fe-S)-binding domain-containing protein n=1 Tax=Stutzerimonas xanthomarina TaxID=271420 RepID=UPI00190C0764|nr:FAD-binding and (Fe-S)-binding domain-containing protein [Stutzerimonas xanthomarina]MBU1303328.1 FAD-binding oxidoreductase [Gammaproteobacteria bacterium]MBK3847748.1 FAD-binding protein [Stutzerimonas xanthomarina]MBU1458485.1 FAD-binding oxidoreductase [Gammaproteobacteria bacterium]MBU2282910.1 FAD-binding oxidoreductase [Gammaproteobacteria bacterium]MBU2373127.1 FAD-binding oxidoreductase [Gammaproteobacteria bacterium]